MQQQKTCIVWPSFNVLDDKMANFLLTIKYFPNYLNFPPAAPCNSKFKSFSTSPWGVHCTVFKFVQIGPKGRIQSLNGLGFGKLHLVTRVRFRNRTQSDLHKCDLRLACSRERCCGSLVRFGGYEIYFSFGKGGSLKVAFNSKACFLEKCTKSWFINLRTLDACLRIRYTKKLTMWPDLAKIRNFSKMLYVFGCLLRVNEVFGTIVILLWQKIYAIG